MLRQLILEWYDRVLFDDTYLWDHVWLDDTLSQADRVFMMVHIRQRAIQSLDHLINTVCTASKNKKKWFNVENLVCMAGAALVRSISRFRSALSERVVQRVVQTLIQRDFSDMRTQMPKWCDLGTYVKRVRRVAEQK